MLVIVKPTDACNCHCIYCSAFYEKNPKRSRMHISTFDLLLKKTAEYLASKNRREIRFLWHGGEPLLMGADFYSRVLKLCEHYEKMFDIEISHIMQSNLHFLDDDTGPVISKLLSKGALSSSFEVIEGIRMIKSDSSEYMKKFHEGLEKAQELNIRVNSVYVVHKYSLSRVPDILSFFSENPLYSLRLNPLARLGRALNNSLQDLYITPQEWGRFLWDFFTLLQKQNRKKPVEPFGEWGLLEGIQKNISCSHGKCIEGILSVDSLGKFYGCGKFSDTQLHSFGRIRKNDIQTLLNSPFRKKIINRKTFLHVTQCDDCSYWEYCRGGCPLDNFDGNIIPFKKTIWCEGLKYFLKKVKGQKKS